MVGPFRLRQLYASAGYLAVEVLAQEAQEIFRFVEPGVWEKLLVLVQRVSWDKCWAVSPLSDDFEVVPNLIIKRVYCGGIY